MRKRVSSADCVRRCARTCSPWSPGSPPGPSAAQCRRNAVWRPRRRRTAARWEPSRCVKGGALFDTLKKPDADASGFLIHSLLRIRLFGSLPSLTCPWGRRSGGRSCCRTRCRRRSRSWRRRISPQARPPGRSPSSWRPPDGRSSPWRR